MKRTPDHHPLRGVTVLSLEVEGLTARGAIRVDEACPLFRGHFPGRPVLPGVAQIGIVVGLGAVAGWSPLSVAALRRLKFLGPVEPGVQLAFEITMDRPAGRLRFALREVEGGGLVSSGTLALRERGAALGLPVTSPSP